QTRESGPLNDQAKEYLMGDIAAVVRGLCEGGATEIIVLDGHGSQAFVPHLMVPGAKYITGIPRPSVMPYLDESFAGIVQLGAHAMMGTQDGVLCHTQSSRNENRYWYNGVESGEIAQVALYAGAFGVPTIMVTGDEAACREARQFLGPEVVTVVVKVGLARESAMLFPFEETRQALYEGAKRAMAQIGKCKPYVIDMPIKAKKQWLVFETPDGPGKLQTKEGVIEDVRDIFRF
ncbi:MAG TPA: M55 family metallopeptidase, partial [Thermogutta sp.]|nr:M55 family metallopeptidase [Thermogutta sp.]